MFFALCPPKEFWTGLEKLHGNEGLLTSEY
jgi:hypothetical protein